MSAASAEALQQYLRRLCERAAGPADAVLLQRLVQSNDREAFALLIARHGPMVLGAARRLVDASHDAEDVFQAVFLSLARRAKTIRQGQTLPAWLHTATYRVAAKVRVQRRNRSLQPSSEPAAPREQGDPAAGLAWQEVRQALDEELQRLPPRLRSPLVLCYLSGLTRDEAAKQLGWSLGTLKRRLEQGRTSLRRRLEGRGIGSVGLALTVLSPEALQAAVSPALLAASLRLIFDPAAMVPAALSALVFNSAGALKGVVMKISLAVLVAVGAGAVIHVSLNRGHPPASAAEIAPGANPGLPAATARNQAAPGDDPLPAGSTLRFGTTRFRHGTRVSTLAVSPLGKIACVAGDGNPLRVFDLGSGRVLYTLNWRGVELGTFAPDGQTLVFKQDATLLVREAATGNEIRTIEGQRGTSWNNSVLEFTPDGKAVAVASQGKVIHLIDYETGRTMRDFPHHNPESALPASFSQVVAVAFSPDGKRMATGGYANAQHNYFARLWDVQTGVELRRFPHGKEGYGIGSLAFSPDGRTLATLGTQAGVFLRLFDTETGELKKAFPPDGELRPGPGSVAFTPDGQTVAAALNAIHLYDVATGKERLRIDRRATHLHFTDKGKTLTAAVDGTIYQWDTATGTSLTPEGGDSVVDQILVTADGKRVISRGQNGYAHVWDGATGKHLRRIRVAWQRGLAISPDGRFLAWPVVDDQVRFNDPQTPDSTHYGTRIRLYDIFADKVVDRLPSFKGSAQDLTFTADGKKLVVIDRHPGTVRIWDVADAEEERSFPIALKVLNDKPHVVWRTTLAPGGKTAVVTYQEHSNVDRWGLRGPPQHILFWDVATATVLPRPEGGAPVDQAFSPDGRLVVLSNGSIWDIAGGKQVAALEAAGFVRAAAFSHDNRLLATTGPGDTIQVWDTATWTKQKQFTGHRDQPTALTFTPAGQLLSGSMDTTVLSWDVQN